MNSTRGPHGGNVAGAAARSLGSIQESCERGSRRNAFSDKFIGRFIVRQRTLLEVGRYSRSGKQDRPTDTSETKGRGRSTFDDPSARDASLRYARTVRLVNASRGWRLLQALTQISDAVAEGALSSRQCSWVITDARRAVRPSKRET